MLSGGCCLRRTAFLQPRNSAGFKPLAITSTAGLKFGIHILRGIPRQAVRENLPIYKSPYRAQDVADTSSGVPGTTICTASDVTKPGARAYVDSLVVLFASWGVDYIKADVMLTISRWRDRAASTTRWSAPTGPSCSVFRPAWR